MNFTNPNSTVFSYLQTNGTIPSIPGRGGMPDFLSLNQPGVSTRGGGANIFRSGMSSNNPQWIGNADENVATQSSMQYNSGSLFGDGPFDYSSARSQGQGPVSMNQANQYQGEGSNKSYNSGNHGGDLPSGSQVGVGGIITALPPGIAPGGGTETPSLVALLHNTNKPEAPPLVSKNSRDLIIIIVLALGLYHLILK